MTAETKKVNVIFLWPTSDGVERGVTEQDVLKLCDKIENASLELRLVTANTLSDALREINKGNVAQYFHKGKVPSNVYSYLGGLKLN